MSELFGVNTSVRYLRRCEPSKHHILFSGTQIGSYLSYDGDSWEVNLNILFARVG